MPRKKRKSNSKVGKWNRARSRKFIIIFALVYFIIIILFWVYENVILAGQNFVIGVIQYIPFSGDYYSSFLGGLLTFCGLLFGFYSLVLVESMHSIYPIFKEHIKKIRREYSVQIFLAIALLILFFSPFYYLFGAVSNSLFAIGGYGFISTLNTSSKFTSQVANSSVTYIRNTAITATKETYYGGWVIIVNIILYCMFELGIIAWVGKNFYRLSNLKKPKRKKKSKISSQKQN